MAEDEPWACIILSYTEQGAATAGLGMGAIITTRHILTVASLVDTLVLYMFIKCVYNSILDNFLYMYYIQYDDPISFCCYTNSFYLL